MRLEVGLFVPLLGMEMSETFLTVLPVQQDLTSLHSPYRP